VIPALLGGGAVDYAAVAVPLRAAYYAGTLGGAGLAFFAVLFGSRLAAEDSARLRRWTCRAAALGILAGVGVLAGQAVALTGGETLLDAEVWGVVVRSRAGASYALGGVGLLLALAPRSKPAAAAGGVLACASHLLVGHTTQGGPRPLLAGLLLVHLLVAAFWIGSLPPLAWAARREGPRAARLVEDWARVAALAVPALVAAGLLLAWSILGGFQRVLMSRYGWALLAKLALVAVLLGFASWHRWRLTPALAAGAPGAGHRLARSIASEAVVALLVLYAAAEMVSTSPGDLPAGYRWTAEGAARTSARRAVGSTRIDAGMPAGERVEGDEGRVREAERDEGPHGNGDDAADEQAAGDRAERDARDELGRRERGHQ
jgi:copper resistance protein D